MSADNWAICPKCTEKALKNKVVASAKAKQAYGKVSADEYLELIKTANIEYEPEYTLREDYELGIFDGEFYVNYHGNCQICGFNFKHSYKEVIKNETFKVLR